MQALAATVMMIALGAPAFAMGERGPDWLKRRTDIGALVVYADGREWSCGAATESVRSD